MSDFFNFNTAEQSTDRSLIPADTVVRAILKIRPGGAGPEGWMKLSKGGDYLLDTEWTILDGPFARRKVWKYMMTSGNETAVNITRQQIRAALEGHHGIAPGDMSPAAQQKRIVSSIAQLDGITACLLIGVEPPKDGYDAKNGIKAILAPDDKRYIPGPGTVTQQLNGVFGAASAPVQATAPAAAFTAPPQAAAPTAAKPAWA